MDNKMTPCDICPTKACCDQREQITLQVGTMMVIDAIKAYERDILPQKIKAAETRLIGDIIAGYGDPDLNRWLCDYRKARGIA
jgi:hypothetical protein